ncbi:MAG: recombinase family protein [Clostridia bacterium]|nr:recombinase family protein [Clostridia bacterium]
MTKSRGREYRDKWTPAIIYRIIRNETYIGNTYKRKTLKKDYKQKKREYIKRADREILESTHPPIISKEIYEKANKMLKNNKTKVNRLKDYKGYLKGIVKCGECGKPLNIYGTQKESGKIEYYFYCTDGKNKNKKCTNSKTINTNRLENIVNSYLKQELKKINEDKIIEESNKYISQKRKSKNDIGKLNKEIEIKKMDIKNLYLQKVNNEITIETFCKKRNYIYNQIKEFEEKIDLIAKDFNEEKQKQDIKCHFENFINEKNLMNYINIFVKEIRIFKDKKIEILNKIL